MRAATLKARLTLGTAALLALALLASALLARASLREAALAHAAAELARGQAVIESFLEARAGRLRLASRVLAADFGFREALALGDPATIEGVLANHGTRIGADAAWWLPLRGPPIPPQGAAFLPSGGRAPETGVVREGGRLLQIVLAEVRAPELLGHVAFGFALDAALAERLSALTGLDVDFAARATAADDARWERWLPLGDGTFAVRMRAEPDALTASFRALEGRTLALSGLVLLAAALLARLLAQRIARPIAELAAAAGRIGRGEFHPIPIPAEPKEVAVLGRSMAAMQEAIAEREAELSRLAFADPATGLPNRAGLVARLAPRLSASARPIAVLVCEWPRLSDIAATLGQATAERALALAGRRLHEAAGGAEAISRVAEQKLALCLEIGSEDEALARAARLLEGLREPLAVEELSLWLDARIGIAIAPLHGDRPETLLQRADAALAASLDLPERIAVYRPGMEESRRRALSVLAALRGALERHELELHFQPQVEIATGRVVGAEGLVRWSRGDLGAVSPAEFVPLAEQCGLVRELTAQVLTLGLAQAERWHRAGLAIGLSLNLSALDLRDQSLPASLRALLSRSAIPPARITLEITESAAMSDPVRARRVFSRLKDLGLRLAIDDFGTGQSSLALLGEWPVDELKLEAGHVRRVAAGGARDEAVARAAIELAARLGLRVVAEGVEDRRAFLRLGSLGCDIAQGWLVAPAMPAADFAGWWERHGRRWTLPAA